MFWTLIWNAITGNLGGIISAVTGTIGKLSDNDTAKLKTALGVDRDVAIAQLQAAGQAYQTRTDLLKGMKVTQWLIAAAMIPPIYHMGGVFLDSCPFFFIPEFAHKVGSWNFVALPKPYDQYEWMLVSSLLGIQSGLTVGMGFAKAMMSKRF